MDSHHRSLIRRNLSKLVQLQNFSKLLELLVQRNVFSQSMIENIQAGKKSTEECAQDLFLMIETRGPNAFRTLVDALTRSGNSDLALELMGSESQKRPLGIQEEMEEEISGVSEDEVDFLSHKTRKRSKLETLEESEVQESTHQKRETELYQIRNESETESSVAQKSTCRNGGYVRDSVVEVFTCYKMTSKPRGYALIVNNIEFLGDPQSKRLGAEVDSISLKCLLQEMDYEVEVFCNVSKKEFLNPYDGILVRFKEKFSHSDVDSCLVSINSHGFDRDWIKMCDPPSSNERDTAIEVFEDVFKQFNNSLFPKFQGKPKIFLINACRGGNANRPVRKSFGRTQTDGANTNTKCAYDEVKDDKVSLYSDFFILRSTVPEHVSKRDMDHGTWFILCICKAFREHANELSFDNLKRKVTELMEARVDEYGHKQSCHSEEFGSTKLLYFNPSL